MGDNKSCKSAKDEHSTKYVFDFFSSMNFDAIRDYVFFVFLFLIFSLQGLSHWRWRRRRKCSISSWRWKVLPAGGELWLFIGTFLNLIFSFSILGRHGACFCKRIACAVGGQILYDRQNKGPQLVTLWVKKSMKHSLEVDHWKITSKLWSNKCLKLQIPVFNICVNLSGDGTVV